ncbi:hypothetical protein ES332_A06G070500v1 [Gossypium tomentosum]|uniref:Uncharacterized protein n=1 Tax=Gossypium tomentosum TaxID=34277 RepID=A0A5D2Q161_GOSTO|nr:hypothetical protein ES332_A06G070500v1 [Gossypium tomentosum]
MEETKTPIVHPRRFYWRWPFERSVRERGHGKPLVGVAGLWC